MLLKFCSKIFIVYSLLFCSAAFSCAFDLDCAPGSKCVKNPGSIYGICYGGMMPGNANDEQPVFAPLDLNGSVGNTCGFNLDCGLNMICLKQGSNLQGVCLPRRR